MRLDRGASCRYCCSSKKSSNNQKFKCGPADKIHLSVATGSCEILPVGVEGGTINNRQGLLVAPLVAVLSPLVAGHNTVQFGLGVTLVIILQAALWLHATSHAGPKTTPRLWLWWNKDKDGEIDKLFREWCGVLKTTHEALSKNHISGALKYQQTHVQFVDLESLKKHNSVFYIYF